MTPENQRHATAFLRTPERRGGIGGPTPTTFATGYLYAGMGYTTVIEAAVPVLTAKHTHEELRDTPIVDKGCCVLMANNEIVLDLLEAGETRASEGCRRLADLGSQGLRGEGGQSRRGHGVEMGKRRQGHVRAGTWIRQSDAGQIVESLARSSINSACRIRFIFTATTWVLQATSPRPSRP